MLKELASFPTIQGPGFAPGSSFVVLLPRVAASRFVEGVNELEDGALIGGREVTDLPEAFEEPKLLRAIEHKAFRRLGGCGVVRSRFRVVAALAEPVNALVVSGRLRQDLAYRLAGVEVTLPPLRARGSDLVLLAAHFLNGQNGHTARAFLESTLARLRRHRWPGNVRELKAVVERVALLSENAALGDVVVDGCVGTRPEGVGTREELELALEAAGGSISAAARLVGLSRTTFRRRLAACRARFHEERPWPVAGHGRPRPGIREPSMQPKSIHDNGL